MFFPASLNKLMSMHYCIKYTIRNYAIKASHTLFFVPLLSANELEEGTRIEELALLSVGGSWNMSFLALGPQSAL